MSTWSKIWGKLFEWREAGTPSLLEVVFAFFAFLPLLAFWAMWHKVLCLSGRHQWSADDVDNSGRYCIFCKARLK